MDNKGVITGTGLVSSLGLSASETWSSLLSGNCGIGPVTAFDARGFACREAALVQGLGPSELRIHPRDSRIMDTHSYMLMKSCRDAYRESNLDAASIPREEIGFFAGMGMVDYTIEDLLPSVLDSYDAQGNFDYSDFFSHAYQQIHPLWPLSMLNNISFCQVAIDLGIKGENTTFSPHADSGMHAIMEACNTVIEKKAKVVIAGGVSEKISPLSLGRASWFNILTKNEAKCMPFGKNRQGTILGEGCGMLTIESRSSARERQTPCLAFISGYGASCEQSDEANCPTSGAISLAMKNAMATAGLQPEDIDLIIAHGDGTFMGDKNEIGAIHQTFATCIDSVNVFSSKGALGHLLAGAPAVDVILGICVLKHGIIPAVYDALPIDDSINFNLVSGKPLKACPRRILINSLSYEGQCASLILEAAD